MRARVIYGLKLLGTDIQFKKGEIVVAVPATNLPEPNLHKWFIHKRSQPERSMLATTPDEIELLG
jgi:hypothetical protein